MGWTKAMMIAAHVQKKDGKVNLDRLIRLAEASTSRALAVQLKEGQQSVEKRRYTSSLHNGIMNSWNGRC